MSADFFTQMRAAFTLQRSLVNELALGGAADRPEDAWYVAAKDVARNEVVVVQGHEHPLLKSRSLVAASPASSSSHNPSSRERAMRRCCAPSCRFRSSRFRSV